MALSMDEQRVLAEIERRLAADDPGLATCLTSFRRPGPATVLRSPRARIIGSLFTILLVTMVSLMVYAMIPFKTHTSRTPTEPSGNTTISASTGQIQSDTAASTSAKAKTSTSAGAVARSSGQPVTPSAGANAVPGGVRGLRSQAGGHDSPAAAGP